MEKESSQERAQLEEVAKTIGYDALLEVTSKYGTGEWDIDLEISPTEKCLAYHNMSHTKRVRDASKQLAKLHGLPLYDQKLTSMIASAHDVIHERNDTQSAEQRSAEWLKNKMAAHGFSDEDIEIARLSILGTTPILDTNGDLISQEFTLIPFPSQRAGEIALCVAVADMEALFSAYAPTEAHNLYKERRGIPTQINPRDLDGFIAFQQEQLHIYKTYQPLIRTLENAAGNLRLQLYNYHQLLLKDVENGAVTTWNEIISRDTRFCQEFTQK